MTTTPKLVCTIYTDGAGRTWKLTKESLPRRRGTFNYWFAELEHGSTCVRTRLKSEALARIREDSQRYLISRGLTV